MSEYVDLRHSIDGYKQELCPACGVERWFKHLDRETWATDQWNCQTCGTYLEQTLELPCPECHTRMVMDDSHTTVRFRCRVNHDHPTIDEYDRGELIDQMTAEYEAAGYAYGRFEMCPVCNERSILNGPDGERSCDECGQFYAGRFMEQWFLYAIWKNEPQRIRVNQP